MATWDEVRATAARLPGVTEEGLTWKVGGKLVAWERPLRRADLAALGPAAPPGPILGIRTVDLAEKEELLAAGPEVFFTIPHFDGHPAVLARLEPLQVEVLEHLLRAIWRVLAPKRVVRAHEAAEGEAPSPKPSPRASS